MESGSGTARETVKREKDAKVKLLLEYFKSNPNDIALHLMSEHPRDTASLAESLPPQVFASAIQPLPLSLLEEIFSQLRSNQSAEVLRHIAVNLSSGILRSLGEARSNEILELVPDKAVVSQIKSLLKYKSGTTGSLMNPNPFAVKKEVSIKDLKKLLKKNTSRYGRYVYVIDDSHLLAGVVSFKEVFYASERRAGRFSHEDQPNNTSS